MKTSVLLALCAACALAQPVKRFAGFGISTVGGNLGCVVTVGGRGAGWGHCPALQGNKLFVNGLEGREITPAEQEELKNYQAELATFRQELKAAMEQRRAELESRRAGGAVSSAAKPAKTPEPPKKPSFCSEQVTTQYIFDGCKVQNNVVYVGSTYARKLTDAEVEELKQFDKEMSVYQKSVSASLEQQLGELFGAAFSGQARVARPSAEPSAAAATAAAPVDAPKTPNFCTLIV